MRRGHGSHEGIRVAPAAKDNNTRRVYHSAAGTYHQDQPSERGTKISRRNVPMGSATGMLRNVDKRCRRSATTKRVREGPHPVSHTQIARLSNIRAASANHGASVPTTSAQVPHIPECRRAGGDP